MTRGGGGRAGCSSTKRQLEIEKIQKVIRVFIQGQSSTQRNAYNTARDNIKLKYSNDYEIIFEERNITQVVNLGLTEDEQVIWLTEKDGCVLNAHPFQGDYPPNWDYGYFLRRLRQVAIESGIPIFPKAREVENDPTFSQVQFLISMLKF